VTLSTPSTLGKNSFIAYDADAKFMDREQFKIDKEGTDWVLYHITSSTNETLCDGLPVSKPIALRSGMVIAVGNSKKKIIKCQVIIDIFDGSEEKTDGDHDLHLPHGSERRSESEKSTKARRSLVLFLSEYIVPALSNIGSVLLRAIRFGLPVIGAILKFVFEIIMALMSSFGRFGGYGGFGGFGGARVHQGSSPYGNIILTIQNGYVYLGDGAFGEVVATISGDSIIRGASRFGEIIATVVEDRVISGPSRYGVTIATIYNQQVIEGGSRFGTTIACVTGGGRMAAAAAAAYLLLM